MMLCVCCRHGGCSRCIDFGKVWHCCAHARSGIFYLSFFSTLVCNEKHNTSRKEYILYINKLVHIYIKCCHFIFLFTEEVPVTEREAAGVLSSQHRVNWTRTGDGDDQQPLQSSNDSEDQPRRRLKKIQTFY